MTQLRDSRCLVTAAAGAPVILTDIQAAPLEQGHEHWKRCVDVNLMGPIHVLEGFVPPMIAAGRGGHIVNVSSAAGLFGLPWHAAYSASKFGPSGT